MAYSEIPDIVIGRLPIYLRELGNLQQEKQEFTSSYELGQHLGIGSAQIRKDLSHFGGFGKQGTGYHIASLIAELRRILKVDREWQVALVGVGDLGRALARYGGFVNRGFRITHLFDNNPEIIGQKIGDLVIMPAADMQAVIRKAAIRIAMIATPADAAQQVASELVRAGVRAILNYAPTVISVPEGVRVQYIDPVIHLQRMTYYLEG